jgi:3-oxoacyl-[acyl-carrier-protein] synthase III
MAYLGAIRFHLPETCLSNEDLVRGNPHWNSEAIYNKTGIRSRHVAGSGETAADLGFCAAEKLIRETGIDRTRIDTLLFCTESPDYVLPPSACILQSRLQLGTSCAALDFNLGCSGFVYGLWLAKALVQSESANNVLLITSDTYSKYCSPRDLATTSIFGDGAAASLITSDATCALATLGPMVLGTDGRGAQHLMVRAGGARFPTCEVGSSVPQRHPGHESTESLLFMDGPEVFSFTIATVQPAIQKLLDILRLRWEDIDKFIFHQANRFMLENLRRQMNIPPEKMPINIELLGNTVSSTIPILLRECELSNVLKAGDRCVLVSFGVGYSWAMGFLSWTG